MQFFYKRRWRLIILGVALILILVSRSILYVNFVQPIALFIWTAWRVMASVNQNVYWTLLLVVGLLPLIWMIFSTDRSVARSAYRQDPLPPRRVEHWEHLLAGADGSQKDQERFHEEWDKLIQSVEAQASRSDKDVFSGDAPGQTGPQPETSYKTTRIAPERGRFPPIQKLWLLLPESVQHRLTRFKKTDDRWIRESLRWMETELDIPNGN
jgi:hypothetical protein